ncbi:hypothetical protein [Apilactobacillus nanyangensis]|uniref:hypothetical protein n=1 Tax=Apilactobacillus nanyangensis TaxID=2799579 RepID=UPI001944E782|nr:hypothetical protein [Apilactobacillus nanyangensis]
MFHPKTDISDSTLLKEIISSLPAFKNSEDDSNNQKILEIIAEIFTQGKNNLLDIAKLTDINYATGQNLTDWGKEYGIDRFDSDDDFLRFEIRWQMMKSVTNTDIDSLKVLVSVLLNIPLTDFNLIKTDNPDELELIGVPFDFATGSHAEQKKQILIDDLQSVLPVEAKLKDIQFIKQSNTTFFFAVFGNKLKNKESEVLDFGDI